jgi:hypothetical protein
MSLWDVGDMGSVCGQVVGSHPAPVVAASRVGDCRHALQPCTGIRLRGRRGTRPASRQLPKEVERCVTN